LEDNKHTGQPRTVRPELKIQDVATLMCTNRSQMVDESAAATRISHDTCHRVLCDDMNISHVTQHSVPCILMQDQCDDRTSTYGDLIDSADKDGTFLNWILMGDET
jgi:hypothetical protein